MKKLTGVLIGLVFLLCMFTAQAQAAIGDPCNIDADCIDELFCNGVESCSSEGSVCVAGTAPCEASQTCIEGDPGFRSH